MLKKNRAKNSRPKNHKTRILFYMVSVEWLFFGCWYLLSSDGLQSIVRLKRACAQLDKQIVQSEGDVARLQRECAEWRSCPFYVERYAREKLSMSYPGDEVLLV